MIEATCSACGTHNRIPEADVPPGSRFITCASCKSRVALPGKATTDMPLAAKPPALPKTPPPKPMAIPSIKQKTDGAHVDLADLPAPKRASPLAGVGDAAQPTKKSAFDALSDLPAPKPPPRQPLVQPLDTDDLMSAEDDLPAPKAKAPIIDLPAPKVRGPIVDLPAPKPVAVRPGPPPTPPMPGVDVDLATDLPAPKPVVAAAKPGTASILDDLDLPKPKDIVDLPQPKNIVDLPQPKTPDLPAPKGFFDDLPQPAKKGVSDLPAPKGFFDDLPQPAKKSAPDLPAPKGFFDDLPQPAKKAAPDLPAPKGFFDDLPQRAQAKSQELQPLRASDVFSNSAINVDLAPSTSGSRPLELEDELAAKPDLDLGLAGPSIATGATQKLPSNVDDLDLAEPSKPPVRFDKPKSDKPKPAMPFAPAPVMVPRSPDLQLEVEGGALPGAERSKAADKKRVAGDPKEAAARAKRRRKVLLGTLLGLIALGGGGYFAYLKLYAEPNARAEQINEHLQSARSALTGADPNHWDRAYRAAQAALEVDETNAEALGIAAEAAVAGAWETGTQIAVRIKNGRAMLTRATDAGVSPAKLARAQALIALATNQPDRAVQKLQPMVQADPKDAFAALYLGWAQSAVGDYKGAVASFTAAATDPKVKVSALYAQGMAYLALADLDHARGDFAIVIEATAKQQPHLGAQVGLAATLPPSQAQQREADLVGITLSKGFDQADERVRMRAWVMLGDIMRGSGRLDGARESYHKALAIAPNDVAAQTGLAATELRDNKIELAASQITKALAQNGKDPDALLVQAEILIKQQQLDAAGDVLAKLAQRDPPLPKLQMARLDLVAGKLLEAQGKDADAVAKYVEGAQLAGELDLAPTMAAVTKLNALIKKTSGDDAARYSKQRDDLLQALDARASDDAKVAMALGEAYLEAGDPAKAVDKLRHAVDLAKDDVQARLEYGRALAKADRLDEGIRQLQAALKIDKSRIDIADEIAQTYEAAPNHTIDAENAYIVLLALPDVPVGARVHAGRFFARTGDMQKAAEQGEAILKAEPDNPAGHYLRGEGLLAAGKLEDARKEIGAAMTADPKNAQYLDAKGRVSEATYATTTDGKFEDDAIRAYQQASELAPTMFNPWAGLGRLYVGRREFEKAIAPLNHAYELDLKSAEVAFNFALTYQALKVTDTAIVWMKKALDNGTKRRGEAYFVLGQLDEQATNHARDAIPNYAQATRLGAEEEKQTGNRPKWLLAAWYRLGQKYEEAGNQGCDAKRAYQQYLALSPPEGVERKTAEGFLNGAGRSCR